MDVGAMYNYYMLYKFLIKFKAFEIKQKINYILMLVIFLIVFFYLFEIIQG